MSDTDKTIFISYRRSVSKHLSLLLFKDLRTNGFDVFRDVDSIGAGEFEKIILNQIAARAHFLVLLAHGTLDRCSEPSDWMRREIEYALDLGRNVVPVLVDGFHFEDAEKHLTGKLIRLKDFQGQSLITDEEDYYDVGVNKLVNQKLKQPFYGSIQPTPPENKEIAQEIIEGAIREPKPTKAQLNAELLYARATNDFEMGDYNEAIENFTKAIEINSEYFDAYNTRGIVYATTGEFDLAIADYEMAIKLNPRFEYPYINRGNARRETGDLEGALTDYNTAIEINPQSVLAYFNRGMIYSKNGDFEEAIADFSQAIRLDPNSAIAYWGRQGLLAQKGDLIRAIADCDKLIELNSIFTLSAHNNRGEFYFSLGQYDRAALNFRKASEMVSSNHFALPGLAITHHALGNIEEAKRLWKILADEDTNYMNADWVQKQLNWAIPLVDETRKLIARF
jgi:tetratricopeptide (TPR) repeat protein